MCGLSPSVGPRPANEDWAGDAAQLELLNRIPTGDDNASMAGQVPAEARVLIVDDERETRVLLRAFLEEEGVTVVGEAASGKESLFMVNRLRPDVVLMDVRMPGMNGIDATRHIKARHPHVQVIILTFLGADEWTDSANDVGAFAYLLKGTPPSVLVGHIWRAAAAAHAVEAFPAAADSV